MSAIASMFLLILPVLVGTPISGRPSFSCKYIDWTSKKLQAELGYSKEKANKIAIDECVRGITNE